jgi:hypothetical protein
MGPSLEKQIPAGDPFTDAADALHNKRTAAVNIHGLTFNGLPAADNRDVFSQGMAFFFPLFPQRLKPLCLKHIKRPFELIKDIAKQLHPVNGAG